MEFRFVKFEVFIPEEYVSEIRKELNKIGALTIGGNYDNCMAVSKVIGSWRPLKGAEPFIGEVGELCEEAECKVEFSCKRELVNEALSTIKRVHPYEAPVINVLPIINGLEITELLD